MRAWLFLALAFATTGCVKRNPPPGVAEITPSVERFPHEVFSQSLAKYVDERGYVDYAGLREDRAALDAYVDWIAHVSPRTHPDLFPTREHELAYYINAYNALVMYGVLSNPGLTNLDTQLVSFFATTRYRVGNDWMTLNDLEWGIVRKQYDDPRVHMVLVCQAISCPRLRQEALQPETINQVMDEMAYEFVASPKNVQVNEEGVAHLSKVFTFYEGDFEAVGGIPAFINRYGGNVPDDAKIRPLHYDWTVRAQPGRGP